MLNNNFYALILTLSLALLWLRLNNLAAARGWVSSATSRKIIHAGTGPIFLACWVLFDSTSSARWLAALVPGLITAQFLLVGLGILGDETAVKALSRSGNRREILRGPLLYGILFTALTVTYWLDTPQGIIALMVLCGGDGLADIFGRKWGRRTLPWSPRKTWMGSLGMLLGSLGFSLGLMGYFGLWGFFHIPLTTLLPALTLIALIATLVESLPLEDWDNLTVTLTALLLAHLLL